MVVNDVRFVDNYTVFIKKDKQLFGAMNPVVGVRLFKSTVLVANMHHSLGSIPMVLLVKECKDVEAAVNTFYRLIGKLTHKTADSKYFDNPKVEEHMCNGNPKATDEAKKLYAEMALELNTCYNMNRF